MYVQRVWCAVHVIFSMHMYVSTGGTRMDFRSIFIPTLLVKMLRMGLSAGGEGRERQWILTQCTNTAHRC